MAQGYTIETFAASVGVHRGTIYNWAENHEEFFDALNKGRELSFKWWLDAGRAGMMGKVPDFKPGVWIFTMKNLHHWGDRDHEQRARDSFKLKREVKEDGRTQELFDALRQKLDRPQEVLPPDTVRSESDSQDGGSITKVGLISMGKVHTD